METVLYIVVFCSVSLEKKMTEKMMEPMNPILLPN